MPYIGNPIYQSAFVTDTFSGNGTTTAFTMSVAPAGVSNVLIAISGVLQDPATYGVVGNTLNFSQAPPTGTNNISCRYLGVPATGVTTTAYRTQTEFTATAGQTTFSVPSYTPGFIDVYRNGALLGSADFTATNGTTVVLNNAASAGDLVETVSFFVSSVINAIPAVAGAVNSSYIANDVTINFADGSASTPSITNNGDTNTGIFFPAADTIAFSEGGTESARFDSAGNLGIGTSSPNAGAKLTVAGGILATGSFSSTTGSTAGIDYNGGELRLFSMGTSGSTKGGYRFIAKGADDSANVPMVIDSSGNLLVGTTSNTRTARLRVFKAGDNVMETEVNNTGAGFIHIGFVNPNGVVGSISTSGSSTSYSTSSDYRLKENISPMTGALDIVQALKPVTYNWKADGSESQGFIAHELQAVVPECVTGEKDAVNEDGSIKAQSIDTSFLVATLTAAIQEQQAIITQLQADVAALKGATE
jgi:hypothetical protein